MVFGMKKNLKTPKSKTFFHPAMNFLSPTVEKKAFKEEKPTVEDIDFTFKNHGTYREIRCPTCMTSWISESMEGFTDFKACHQLDIMDCGHILFRFEMIFDDANKPHFFRNFFLPNEVDFTTRFNNFYKKKIKNNGRHQYPDLAFYELLFNDPSLFGGFGYEFLDTVYVTPDNQNSDFRSGNRRRIIFGFQDEKKEIQRLFKHKR